MKYTCLVSCGSSNTSLLQLYSKIRELDGIVKICFLTASDISEEFNKGLFADELDNAQEKVCFITIPITNDDLRKRIRELLELK